MPNGIDELASEIANLKAYQLLQYKIFGVTAEFSEKIKCLAIFLANQIAYDLSVDHFLNSELIISGLPKYDDYKVHANKQFEFRIKDKLDIGIFLQPFDIGPYKSLLNILSGSYHAQRSIIFFVNLTSRKDWSINLMKENFKGINFIRDNKNLDLFRTLDVLITVDSTCAIDFHEYSNFLKIIG